MAKTPVQVGQQISEAISGSLLIANPRKKANDILEKELPFDRETPKLITIRERLDALDEAIGLQDKLGRVKKLSYGNENLKVLGDLKAELKRDEQNEYKQLKADAFDILIKNLAKGKLDTNSWELLTPEDQTELWEKAVEGLASMEATTVCHSDIGEGRKETPGLVEILKNIAPEGQDTKCLDAISQIGKTFTTIKKHIISGTEINITHFGNLPQDVQKQMLDRLDEILSPMFATFPYATNRLMALRNQFKCFVTADTAMSTASRRKLGATPQGQESKTFTQPEIREAFKALKQHIIFGKQFDNSVFNDLDQNKQAGMVLALQEELSDFMTVPDIKGRFDALVEKYGLNLENMSDEKKRMCRILGAEVGKSSKPPSR